jgi:hypothetical protein
MPSSLWKEIHPSYSQGESKPKAIYVIMAGGSFVIWLIFFISFFVS